MVPHVPIPSPGVIQQKPDITLQIEGLCWTKGVPTTNKKQSVQLHKSSLVAQMVKNQPAVQKTWVQALGQKDLLEKGMATHSSILAWRIPWTEEPGELHSMVKVCRVKIMPNVFV